MNPLRFIQYLIYRWKCHRYGWESYNYADWVWENDYLDYLETASDYDDNYDDQAWLCRCGHYQEDGLHCDCCGNEPPWGCDCGFCNDHYGTDEDDDFLYYWADYPGHLLADDIDFYQEV